ncbi:MAG: two-component system alkaline phosphatase synthesis response regulator PhoP [Salibacteraceae bacterium]|jgi:two-component system alkaline phosphatase synthesis response regulator PhoP
MFMADRILLVEDEPSLYEALKLNLELEGYNVTVAVDGEQALEKFKSSHFHLIILDVMIPKIDGYVVCETIRLENSQIPILFLSAKNSAEDKINGLKTGADDYMAKPFNLEEFLLRVSVLVKRSHALAESTVEELNQFQFGENKVDFGSFEITTWDEQVKSLSKREMKLLKLLIEKRGKVVSREEILQKIWGYDVFPSTRTIDNYILAFRKYFEKNQRQPKHFFSVRGVGYKFESED